MAHVLTLYDGTTTINLTSASTSFVTAYAPMTPELSRQEPNVAMVTDGGAIPLTTRRNVTETIELIVLGSTKAVMQTNINAIEKMILAAERYQRYRVGTPVYLQAQFDGEAGTWRSEILAGSVELSADSMQLWTNIRIPVRLHITRRWFWESTTLTELELSSSGTGTPTTGGVTIYVNDDATAAQTNWIGIASTQVTGTLPAPIKLQLTNNSGGDLDPCSWYLSNNAFDAPTTFDPFLLAAENYETSGALSWTTNDYVHYQLGSSRMAVMAGQSWRVLMALTALSAGTHYARVGLCWHGGSGAFWPVWWGEETAISGASVYDLGAVQIPPDTASDVWIILHIRSGTSGTATLDFLQLQPAENHRYIRQTFGLSDGDALIDDGVQGYVYYYSSSAKSYPVTIGYGSPLEIYPGVAQRLRVMWSLAGDLGTTLEAQAWYRPRRLTV